ncbi:type II toxin-antitoxin system PemK/MazF family toxin [Streptomyces sp. NBC_00887]|uniref:type II toxin-antitoxin system PemK/MazF family toxin n=1 Tax=Streptomyces sp. NBC_00887 TaxID=2975859 RepID=UPI00386A8023|nr:type II toxin-antitoxin system PemK/MazF family toxin [Streptomyces sp. NBC_00887]
MKRGDIYLVDYEPVRGGEADKARPSVIISNDGANAVVARTGRGVVTVVPLTANVARIYPFQVLLQAGETGLTRDSKVQCEQVRAMAEERFVRQVGTVPRQRMADIDAALRRHLAL